MVRSYDWFDDCQQVKNVSLEKTEHPCQISVAMMERIISVSGSDLVIDPFMGSGTTGEAALKLGRMFIGIERERKYFDIACARQKAHQAQQTLFAPEYQAPGKRVCWMKCRDCKHAINGPTQGDTEMAKIGYRICALSRTEVERASYFLGDHLCKWPNRLSARKG